MPASRLLFLSLLMLLTVSPGVRGQVLEDEKFRTVVKMAPAGVRRYEPGSWSTLMVNGINKTDEDSDEFVALFIGENSDLQFARRFWLPAKTRRQTWLPILIPKNAAANRPEGIAGTPQVDAAVMRLKEGAGGETFDHNPLETHIVRQPLLVDRMQTKAGVLFRRAMPDATGLAPEMDWDSYETAYKARQAASGTRVMIDFGADFIPPFQCTLDSLDQMVISGDRILNDSAGLAQLRHWLQQGGRVWIMVNHTSMETVNALLGDATCYSIVDRVELNEFQLENLYDPQDASAKPTLESWSAEIPVEMVRVFADTDDIACRVDGWPAAFWQKVGRGEVLFTTVGPRGWIEAGEPKQALRAVAERFFQPREAVEVDPVAMAPLLNDQIGYRIPTRGLATTLLGLNSVTILLFGCWWARQRRLERLAWLVPCVALSATAVFLVIGSRNAAAVPSTVAVGQIVRVSRETNESHVTAVSAIYSQDSGEMALTADNGAMATATVQEARGAIKRVVWDDNGRSHWKNIQQPSGVVRYVESQRTVSHATRRTAHVTFDDSGFHGTLSGLDPAICEDLLIVAAPAPAIVVSLDSAGSFQGGSRDVLAPGQYFAGGLMSDKQRSRQELLREMLASSSVNQFGTAPSLLVWTPLLDMGVEFSEDFERLGSALTSIPLQIERPPAGTNVMIPATFIRIEAYAGGQGASSVFNPRTGKWLFQPTKPTRSQVRCVVPKALQPLRLNTVTVTLKINAPSRGLRIEGIVNGTSTVLHEREDPIGVLRFEIDRPEALEFDADGGLHLAIIVTETKQQRQVREGTRPPETSGFDNSTWQIDYLRVDATGTTL